MLDKAKKTWHGHIRELFISGASAMKTKVLNVDTWLLRWVAEIKFLNVILRIRE